MDLDQSRCNFLLHYLDDYLTIGPPNSHICQRNLSLLVEVCAMLGIPLALDKVVSPSTALKFLGFVLDIERMEARLPRDELSRIQTTIVEWLNKRSATKWEILSLVGVLQHVAKVVHPGHTFVRCMYSEGARARLLHPPEQGVQI